jgi:hypothetical protein
MVTYSCGIPEKKSNVFFAYNFADLQVKYSANISFRRLKLGLFVCLFVCLFCCCPMSSNTRLQSESSCSRLRNLSGPPYIRDGSRTFVIFESASDLSLTWCVCVWHGRLNDVLVVVCLLEKRRVTSHVASASARSATYMQSHASGRSSLHERTVSTGNGTVANHRLEYWRPSVPPISSLGHRNIDTMLFQSNGGYMGTSSLLILAPSCLRFILSLVHSTRSSKRSSPLPR